MLIGVTLSLKERGKNQLVLSLSPGSRIIFVFFFLLSCFVLVSGVCFGNEATLFSSANTLPFLLVCLTGAGAFYQERWIFDRKDNRVESQYGLTFLYRKRTFPLDDLVRVELVSFTRGFAGGNREAQEEPKRTDAPSRSGETPFQGLRGPFQRSGAHRMLRLIIIDRQDQAHVLDSDKGHAIEEFHRTGRRIADFCSLPFQEHSTSS
jgi:hypothetical protein